MVANDEMHVVVVEWMFFFVLIILVFLCVPTNSIIILSAAENKLRSNYYFYFSKILKKNNFQLLTILPKTMSLYFNIAFCDLLMGLIVMPWVVYYIQYSRTPI
eukprot:sb/3478285/